MAILMIDKISGGRIIENSVIRVVYDPAVASERPKCPVKTGCDSSLKNIEGRTVKYCLSRIAQLGTPSFPNRVFRMASRHDKCTTLGAQNACDVREQARQIFDQM